MEIKIFGTPDEIAALATQLQERQADKKPIQGYAIASPYCGRDENGVFHCFCGKCRPLRKKGND